MHRARHPFFENLVFGLAGLLALILLYAIGTRVLARGGSASSYPGVASGAASSGGFGQDVPEGGSLVSYRTHAAVDAVPPAQASFGAAQKTVAVSVPAPNAR